MAPGLRTEMVADSGHFPHKDHPDQFVALVEDFMATTQAAVYSRARFRTMLRSGAPDSRGDATVTPLRALRDA